MSKKYNIVIVGSGFSGIVAANKLSGHGLSILMIDENFHIGGQLLRKIPEKLGINKNYTPDFIKKTGNKFVTNLKIHEIDIMNSASVIGIYDDNEILIEVDKDRVESVIFEVILFATGARERYLPFKGWTLPGVFSAGMGQVLMKSSGILPSRKVVVAGSGLFLFAAGYEFLKNGAKVLSVFESRGMKDKIRMIPPLLHHFSKMFEGIRYIGKIALSGVPVRHNMRIIEARGKDSLEEIIVCKTDSTGKIISGKERIIRTNGLAYSYGFVPNIELPNLAGCKIKFDKALGGWVTDVDENMESSVGGRFCAGEINGVGGALKSINEGEIASLSILQRYNKGNTESIERAKGKLLKDRKYHLEFAICFNTLYGIRDNEISEIPDETMICRCEDVKMGEIRSAISNGFTTPGALKTAVRAGMGNCQGRTCGPLIYDLLALGPGQSGNNFSPFSNRPPLKPVKIGSLISRN